MTTEECDDGDTDNGDGCSSTCTVEPYWDCTGIPSFCDGICGDGKIRGLEECDDGDEEAGDGCSATCKVEDTWGCTTAEPSQCSTCGDGFVLAAIGEECEDGNTSNGDCCSGACKLEPSGTVCTGDGNICTDDECDGAGTCLHNNNTLACNDGSLCTVNDTCTNGDCVGDFIDPWINEIDYNSEAGGTILGGNPQVDYEEYVEIAAPAGMDLGGYQIVDVDGRGYCCGPWW